MIDTLINKRIDAHIEEHKGLYTEADIKKLRLIWYAQIETKLNKELRKNPNFNTETVKRMALESIALTDKDRGLIQACEEVGSIIDMMMSYPSGVKAVFISKIATL